ncbi:MAG: alpha/beta hydrolase [Mycobacteriaceae bacterium]
MALLFFVGSGTIQVVKSFGVGNLLRIAVASGLAMASAVAVGDAAQAAPPAPILGSLDQFYNQAVQWGPCQSFARSDFDAIYYANPRLECGRVSAPLSYELPDASQVSLAVMRIKATGPKIGSLVVNPGGPGGSGIRFVADMLGAPSLSELSQNFDVVGLDPRGVNASTPAVDCWSDQDFDQMRAAQVWPDYGPIGEYFPQIYSLDFSARCAAKSTPQLLQFVGTRESARDLDIVRAALGEEQLNYLGFSYGTQLGTAYAEAFPENVRAMVFDGALDPEENAEDRTAKQEVAFEQALKSYVTDCVNRPSCPLGADIQSAAIRLNDLLIPLADNPLPLSDGRVLSINDARMGINAALYSQMAWPRLTDGLYRLGTGDGLGLMQLADLYYERDSSGRYSNAQDAFVAISCVDGTFVCDLWPTVPTSYPHTPSAVGLPKVVVISTTGDPATPYAAGVSLAAQLGASLITFEGKQHTVALSGVACVDNAVNSYFTDLTSPVQGLIC